MINSNSRGQRVPEWAHRAFIPAVSIVAIGAAFALAITPFDWIAKTVGFVAIEASFAALATAIYLRGRRSIDKSTAADAQAEQSLAVLEEISQFFAGTIKTADAFRLVVSKVNELLPSSTVLLIAVDRAAGRIRVVQAYGDNSEMHRNTDIQMSGLAGRCADLGTVQVERQASGLGSFSADSKPGSQACAAVPLKRDGEVLAVLQFYSASGSAFDQNGIALLEAIGERVGPMILGALSYESSVSSALTDTTTGLPNERAFRMVLENQIAESHRRGSERPLTIISFQIKQFDEVNRRFGHAAGDQMLDRMAAALKMQLRQMDFFARSSNDEFLAALPTADENIAEGIVARMNAELLSMSFRVGESESIRLEVSCGIAMFGMHGETADSLIAVARQRKRHDHSASSPSILWFPGNSIN